MINSNKINPYLSNLSITSIWSIGSFFINLLPIYFLNNNLYAELIVCTTTIFLLNQVLTLGLSDSILKYGNSILYLTLLLILINSLVVNFFLDYKIVLGSLGLSSMITIRNYFVKNNLEHKLIKITFFIVLVRILASYFILKNNFSIESYIVFLFLIPGLFISITGLILIRSKQNNLNLVIKKEILIFAITTLISRFLFNYSTRISIFILDNQKSYEELKIFGFLLSFLGVISIINQSIRSVLIGKTSSDISIAKEKFYLLVKKIKLFIPVNFIVSVVLSSVVYFSFSKITLDSIVWNVEIIVLVFLFFTIHGFIIYSGLFNIFLRTINKIEIEIIMNLIRLLLIYLVGTILHGIQFLIVYLFILFFVELILAKISSHLLLNWKK